MVSPASRERTRKEVKSASFVVAAAADRLFF